MATNKIHFLATMLVPYLINIDEVTAKRYCSAKAAAVLTTPDSMRCWSGSREYSHFTINPKTGEISGATFPKESVKEWNEEIVKSIDCYSAGKPGSAVVDEATIPDAMWVWNEWSEQNFLFYLHLLQDKAYDRFVRSVIDVSGRYEDKYRFNGELFSGAQIRGQGMERWSRGLINELDDQFYVRLAKRYYEKKNVKANNFWLKHVMCKAIRQVYSDDLANNTVKYISLSERADELIKNLSFDDPNWPVPNWIVDQAIDWMMEDMNNVFLNYEL